MDRNYYASSIDIATILYEARDVDGQGRKLMVPLYSRAVSAAYTKITTVVNDEATLKKMNAYIDDAMKKVTAWAKRNGHELIAHYDNDTSVNLLYKCGASQNLYIEVAFTSTAFELMPLPAPSMS